MNTKETVERELNAIDVKLKTLDPHTQSAEYKSLLEIRAMLLEQRESGILQRVDPNMVLKVLATFGVAGAIMLFEVYGNIFTSKASAFMPKLL